VGDRPERAPRKQSVRQAGRDESRRYGSVLRRAASNRCVAGPAGHNYRRVKSRCEHVNRCWRWRTCSRGGRRSGNIAKHTSPESVRGEILSKLHAPILFLNGGPSDSGFASAKSNFEAIGHGAVVLAYQEVGHYPATYRQPNGGAFAKAVGAWLKWQLKGDQNAKKMYVGDSCGLCKDSTWKIERKKLD
jgi:pimeloyl-ACP methyl ester carboxylesterase